MGEAEADITVVGVPGRAVKRAGERIRQSFELDQIHVPDPVSQEFCKIRLEVERLKAEMLRYEESIKNLKNRLDPDLDCKDNKGNTGDTQNEE